MTNTAFRGVRPVIVILGRCNTGKSSLLNFITGQPVAMVSPTPGTTADPLSKPFELLPLGPVTFYDTAGLDEDSPLGQMRGQASRKVIARADMAVLITDEKGIGPLEMECAARLKELDVPFLVVFNKNDIARPRQQDIAWCRENNLTFLPLSLNQEQSPLSLRQALLDLAPARLWQPPPLLSDLLKPNPLVICVIPIDSGAPAGRLIVPQVQVLRELVDIEGTSLVLRPEQLALGLERLSARPDLVVTDSQAIMQVNGILPENIPLTTFSLLFARQKGDFKLMLKGARHIENLKDNNRVLIAEACSHHAQKEDIGRIKLPAWLEAHTGKKLLFDFCAGVSFPENLKQYALVVHCGGCMLNNKGMRERLFYCQENNVPVTNFGMAISQCQGLLARAAKIFKL